MMLRRLEMRTNRGAADSFSSREISGKLHQGSHRSSGRTFGDPRLLVFHPRSSGDIEMQPGCVLGAFFQDHGRGNRAAVTSTRIYDVGDIGADLLFVFFVEWHTPHL